MMAYGHTIKKRNNKKERAVTRQLEPRVVLASLAMAAGIFAHPFIAGATTITPKDANDAQKITQDGNVYNINPQHEIDKFAYNRFDKFVLSAGDIANLKFGGADALANLVNSKIDINGTVNAIKGSGIGGHLYFLSPDGIAVGASGVINAGQFTGIVPTRTAFDTLYNATNNPDAVITLAAIEQINKDGAYAAVKTDADGTKTGIIDVGGQINTHSGVMMGAGVININDGATLQSVKDLDFTNLVNTGSANAGLNSLTASAGSGGDIVLTAKQTSEVKDTKTIKENGQDKEVANAIRWGERSTDLFAAVNIGKNVTITSSDGAVKITAESASTYEDSTPMTLTGVMRGLVFGNEETVIDGLIDKLEKKEAGANKYLFVNYSNKKNKASVNVGENSTITGKNIDIAAKSTLEIKQSVAPAPAGAGKKDSEGKEIKDDGPTVLAAVAISRVYNSADVVIDGNLTAAGADAETGSGISISANADTKAALSAAAGGGTNTKTAAGVAVLSGDTKAKVTVKEGATPLSAAQGKVSIDATTASDIDVKANAVGGGSYVVSNVGVANYDTNADVTVNRSVNAGAVDVKAENTIAGLKMTVDNTVPESSGGNTGKDTEQLTEEEQNQDAADAKEEKDKGDAGKSEDEKESEKKSIDPTKVLKDANVDTSDEKTKDAAGSDGKGGVQDVKDKLEGSNDGGDNAKKNSAFGLGAAVGVFLNENNANVTIGKNAVITAAKPDGGAEAVDGSVNIHAKTLMTPAADAEDKENRFAFSVKNTLANANVEIGAAVLVSNVQNNATVLLDSDGTNAAQITGSGKTALNASAGMGTYKDGAEDKTGVLAYAVSAAGTAEDDNPSKFALDGSVGVNTQKNNAVVFLGQKSKAEGAEVALSSDAVANAKGTYGATEGNSKIGIGGTVGLQNIRNNSLVMAGKDVQLTATGEDKSVEAKANNSLGAANEVKNAGKGNSIGISGMVALSYGDSNSIVSIDDEAKIKGDSVSIESENSTNVDNSARGETTTTEGSKAFGIGVGIVNYDVNSVAMVADNGGGISAPSGSSTDAEKAAQKIYNDAKLAQSVAGTALAGKLGTKTDGAKGSITTGDLSLSALTTGMLKNDAKAKAAPEEKEADAESGDGDKTEKWTNWSKQGDEGAKDAKKKTEDLEQDKVESQNAAPAPAAGGIPKKNNASGAAQEASSEANPDATPTAPDDGAAPAAGSAESAGASIGVEGSVALTFLGGRTDAVLDNVTVKNETTENETVKPASVDSVTLSATDFLGSITLGGTNVKHSLTTGSATKVGIGGTFAMNSVNRDVDSFMKRSEIRDVVYVANEASKIGIEVAAGMGVSAASGSGTSVSGAGVVYYNKAVQDVHALLIDNTVTSNSFFTMLSNEATSTDFQVAGGLAYNSASGEGTNVGVGGAVAVSQLENNMASGIIGGKYTDFTTVKVAAEKGTTQINGALAPTKAGGANGYGFEGAFAYGSVKNNVHAYISGAETKDTLGLGKVQVKAGEVSIDLTAETAAKKAEIDKLTKLKAEKRNELKAALDKEKTETGNNKKTLEDTKIDPTGKIYLDPADAASSLEDDAKNTDEGKIAGEAAGDEKSAKSLLDGNYSRTITAAMAGGWAGAAGAGAGIAYNYVKNDIAADIKDSTLATYEVTGEAASDSLIVSVGAGAAIGGKAFNGAGSGSWNDLKNDTKVTIANNTITGATILDGAGVTGLAGGKLTAQAENTASIINIAGEVAGGKGMATGLSLAYNSLNNTTGSYLTGNTVSMPDIVGNNESAVKVTSMNKSNALAVAGGVDVNITQSNFGAGGTVAINRGVNHTESVVDGKTSGENTKLDNLKQLVVAAEELTKKTTVAGGISVGGKKIGVGGAVAYTAIGSSGNKERLLAEVNHADVTTTDNGTIIVSTTDSKKKENSDEVDKSRVTTVGAGVGVEWGKNWFNLQGAAAVSDIYKDSRASLNNTNINENTEEKPNNADKHPTIDVSADAKSKINTVGAVGNISVKGVVTGTVGIAINRMDQDTKAEMATDDGKTTTVNAGRTEVRAVGDGDIHSVGVGTTVSVLERAAAAGSGSYNYIGNDVDAVIKNQNLASNNNVGVVAQSDDRLYNFAGGFSIGAATNVALGTAASTNKITGSTNALVKGGSVVASGSDQAADAVKVTRPSDDKLFTTEKLDLTTDRTKLAESRTDVSKTGIVVDSSATHTLISQLSSGGVGANSSFAVNLDGTVNINTIDGKTTAKIQDANLNSESKVSDVNVNAVDYTNVGSFTGTPAIAAAAAAGVSVGVSANWETLNRATEAEISASSASDKKNVYAKDLTVDATAKHGSSALSFAAAAGGGKVGVSSGDSIMRHKYTNTTSALLKNVNAQFDGAAEIKAEHLGNTHSQNIAVGVSAGMVAVAAGAGVSVMDDTSTVKAEVDGSNLKAKTSTDGKNISVLAKNENNWKNTLVTANLAVGIGAGVAANVGVNNTSGETAALVTKSELEAYDVAVKAEDKLTVKSTGGVGAGGVGGVGVAVALNNINSSTSAHVTGGKVVAAHNIDVAAEETRSFDGQVTGAAAGGIGVGVNVAVTSINKGITDAQLSSAKDENNNPTGVGDTTQNEIKKHLASVNNAKGALGDSRAKFYGMSASDKENLTAAKNTTVSLATPKTNTQGVHTSVSGASLTAAENVNVKATDTSEIFAKNVGVTAAGAASVNVTDNIIHTNYDTDVTMNKATVTGKNVNISALQTQGEARDGKQGSDVRVTAVTVGALGGVGVGYAGIVNKSATDVNISDSTVKATENVTVGATDASKHNSQILSVGVAALNVTTTFASLENTSNVGVTLGGTNNISAGKNIAIDAKKANALEAHTQGVGVGGVNVAVNHATIEDKGTAAAKITGTNGTFSAEKFHLGAANDATAKLSAGNTAVSVLGVSRMRGKGDMTMGADVSVAGGSFNAKTVEFASSLGTANGRTLEGNVKGHNISAVAVAPDAVILNTTVTSNVNVANSTFSEDADLVLANESYVDRKAYIYDVTAGAVAVGNSSADVYGKETMNTSLTGKSGITSKLASLEIVTYGENKGKAFADAGGGGLGGYIGAHVRNDSINNVTSSLGGKWDIAGEAWLVAAQKDETRLTASEGHGGVIGVGGTSADNVINTTTNATVQSGTEITADRVHIGASNAVTTGAYDDTDSKGKEDVQTYTLKDHFGGAISGNRLRSLVKLTENGTVNIGANAKITTNKLQEYIAASQSDLTNLVQAKGGAAVGITDAVSEFDLGVHNTINVGSGAVLTNEKAASTEDIILSAYDNHSLKSHVDATTGAAAAFIKACNEIDMNRTSEVNVAGTIESGSNVGLYAGADEKGALSNLNADLKSGAYNYSVVPATIPQVQYVISADRGNVDVSGTVRSNKDINAIASGGKEKITKDQSLWNWAVGGSSTDKTFLTSDAVTAEEALPKQSTVRVTGALIAGTADRINLTVGGSVANGLTITAPDNRANNRVKNGVTQGTFDYANVLGARLQKLNELIAAYDGNNSANGGTEVMAAYIAERTRIQNEMKKLGLTETDTSGNTVYSNSGRPVYYVEIPDISTSGGNINVTANDFVGTGSLRANSAPGVTITNHSDAYLKLNNIIMGEQGGKITYNGIDNVIPANVGQGNAKINSINVSKSGASFREIYGVTNGEAANLLVKNDPTVPLESAVRLTEEKKRQLRQEVENDATLSAADKATLLSEINTKSIDYKAMPDVEVNGKISNFYGQVEINNTKGDIRINGGTQARPTGVFGNSVKLIAANGTIAQDYKDGIVNIGGDPEKYLDSYTNYTDNQLITDAEQNMQFETINVWAGGPLENILPPKYVTVRKPGSSLSGSATTTYTRPASTPEATGYIAGRDVYVSAANINVNGLIQSGYKNYTATVTVDDLNAAKTRPADKAAIVQNRTMYKVNEGGAKWNFTEQVFDYVAQVYWDPSTDKLFVEDIDTAGGKIYLTGKIAGTGDGRILAADGAALITVTNETALDMNVGKVLNNQREGVITIADTAKDAWTEYKRGQTRTINNYAAYLKEHANDGDPYAAASVITAADDPAKVLSIDHSLTYNPKEKQTYNWTKGKTVETTKEYLHHKRYGLWGAVETKDATELKSEAKVVKETQPKEYNLPEGAVIRQDSDTGLSGNTLRLDTTSNLLSSWRSEPERWLKKTGFFGWFRNYYTRWTEGTKTLKTYNYSISASNPITIGLIGHTTGQIDIASTNANGGNINLTGNVANSHNAAKLNISSAAGGITQFDNTLLKSEVVNLSAKNDIKNIHLASVGTKDANGNVTDNIKLSAISSGKGDIDVTAVGGLLENQSLPGNVEIVALKSRNGDAAFDSNADLGDVTLTANGNITQSGDAVTVEGRGITLTSRDSGIGTAERAIQIAGADLVYSTDRYGAQVNASAKDSIYLTESGANNNMRVGKIESREGDVTLTVANGSFIDGLPHDDKTGSLDSVDEMVHRWIDAGLIEGENGYEGAYVKELKKNRDDYKARITSEYTEYKARETAAKGVFESQDYKDYRDGTGGYAELTDAQKSAKLLVEGHQDYLTYKDYATADDYLKTTDGYKFKDYADANAYLAADAKYQDLSNKADNPTYEWTKDMMLYAVSDAIVNPSSGRSTQTDGPANVLGNNVTLVSSHTVGTVSDTTKTITVDELSNADTRIDKMKELMGVGAADVTAVRENGNLTKFVIKGNMPLGVKAEGTLNVQAGGNVSVAGRTDTAGEHSAINVGNINATATGDVRLYSAEGVTNALADDAANKINITGKNLIVTGGKESIGAADKPLTVSLSGDLTEARADKNVYIKNLNDSDFLRLGAMFASDTISLDSKKGFLMSSANANIADSYINAGKTLVFKTDEDSGVVGGMDGETDRGIRILNNRAPVNIGAGSAYIKGMDSLAHGVQNGTLTLGEINIKNDFTVESAGKIAQTETGKVVAGTVTTRSGESLILENDGNKFNSITVDGVTTKNKETGAEEKPDIAGDVRVKDGSDALTVEIKRNVAGEVSAQNSGNLTQKGTLAAGVGVTLASTAGAVAQAADAGVKTQPTQKVTVVSAKGVDLQGTGNAFDVLTVKSAAENAPIAGSVSVKDSADKLTLSVNPAVNGNITVENTKAQGTLNVVSELHANDDALTHVKGDISLKSDGSMQTDKTMAAMGDVKLTATNGDVTIKGDISTGTAPPAVAESPIFTLEGDYNSLVISAGGAITEDAGVTIATPVVETYSGKGVSMESEKNDFDYFMADASSGDTIDGSVKVKTDSSDGEDGFFTAALGASVRGDAEFTNLAQDGSLGIVATGNAAIIDVQGGNGADGNLVLTAKQDVGMLGNASAAKDIVIESENGMFFGLAKGMTAGNDVKVSAGDAVNYVGTINAVHDLHIRVTNPNPESDASVIHIGAFGLDDNTLLAAGNEARFEVQGDGNVELNGAVVAQAGDVAANISGAGSVLISEIVESRNGSVSVETGKGDIVIGTDSLSDGDTVKAKQDVTVGTGTGTITIQGATTAKTGDVVMTAGKDSYEAGTDYGNFIIANDGKVVAEQGGVTLNGRNGDVVITDDIQAGKNLTVNIKGQGDLGFGNDLTVTNDVNIATEKGSILVGHEVTSTEGNVNMTTGEGDVSVFKAVTAAQDLEITTGKGDILIGSNGPEDPTVSAKQNATVGTELGIVTIYGKTEAEEGDVTLYAGSEEYTQAGKEVEIDEDGHVIKGGEGHTIVIDQEGVVIAGRDVNLGALNDDILVTDRIKAKRDVTAAVTGKGRIFFPGQVVDAKEELNVALENGDFVLNRGSGTRVSIWMENNSELSYLGQIVADANGDARPDVTLTGNYITVGSITKRDGGSTFTVSTTGARGRKYIAEEITVDSLASDTGTQMPSLWSNRGYVHIDEGAMNITDVLAGDKIHLENDQTTLAVYGRTPTKDGEQLVYWNNVGMANSKTRGFNLFTDGKVRTRKAILVDSYRNYYKLLGDNLSVVDMMRDHVTHERGEYTFDSKTLTEPGRLLREPMFFGVESTDVVIQQQNATDAEIVVES